MRPRFGAARVPAAEAVADPGAPAQEDIATARSRILAADGRVSARIGRRGALVTGAALLVAIVGASLAAPWLSPYDAIDPNLRNALRPPSWEHPIGTDNFGRDVLTRVLSAAQVDLRIAFLCVVFPWILGTLLGALAGYAGGVLDTLIMRTVDTFTAFPVLVMAIGVIAVLGPGVWSMYIALTLAVWSMYARVVRAEVLVAKRSEYVLAARALGYSHARIMARHVLPNVITATIVFAMTDIVLVILSTTTLAFLGLGLPRPAPAPAWGTMIAEGNSYIFTAWWMVTLPGLAIVADWLRERE